MSMNKRKKGKKIGEKGGKENAEKNWSLQI